jgi:SLT domain-containing protein
MTDTPTSRGIEALARGHSLYAGHYLDAGLEPVAQRVEDLAGRLVWLTARPGLGPAESATGVLAGRLRRIAAVDAELAAGLAAAHAGRELGHRATRAVLDDAVADAAPAVDTALGQREAQRRMATRLRTQHHHIRRSRLHSQLLARATRALAYPHRRSGITAAHGLPLQAVRYTRSSGVGHIRQRIEEALDRLGITAPAARRNWLRGYETLIARESGGRASAVASEPATDPGPVQADGHRLGYARGITQTIPATFAWHHQPGTSNNIYDPVANICASMNYVMHRYGVAADGTNLAALVQQADRHRPPRGY